MTFYELRHFENLQRLSRIPVSQSAAEAITGIIIPANVLAIVNPTGTPQPDGKSSTDINYILNSEHSSLDHIVFMYDYDAQKAQDGEYYAIDQYDSLEFSASTLFLYTGKIYINNSITTTGGFQKLRQAFSKVTDSNWETYDGYDRNGLPMIPELFRNYEDTEKEWIKML